MGKAASKTVRVNVEVTPEQRDFWKQWAAPGTLSKAIRGVMDEATGFAVGKMKPPPATGRQAATRNEPTRTCCARSLQVLGRTTCVICGKKIATEGGDGDVGGEVSTDVEGLVQGGGEAGAADSGEARGDAGESPVPAGDAPDGAGYTPPARDEGEGR